MLPPSTNLKVIAGCERLLHGTLQLNDIIIHPQGAHDRLTHESVYYACVGLQIHDLIAKKLICCAFRPAQYVFEKGGKRLDTSIMYGRPVYVKAPEVSLWCLLMNHKARAVHQAYRLYRRIRAYFKNRKGGV